MATDAERREVARRLREYASWYGEEDCLVDCADWGERVLNLLGCGDMEGECYAALADLIEPPLQCPHYHSDRHYCSVHEDVQLIDRDALLALADEISDTSCDNHGELSVSLGDIWGWSSRIRKALGVES